MKIFIAGATGATGQVLVPMAEAAGLDLVLHVRPQSKDKSPLGKDPRAKIFDLTDEEALVAALAGVDVVVSLVGTMRNRFAKGDTYESSDIGSTKSLVAGAKKANVPRFLLLSSVGAGGVGAYLKMKGECERIVFDSGLSWTIFRPSALVSPKDAETGNHGAREERPAMDVALKAIGALPGLAGFSKDYRPIGIEVVAKKMLEVIAKPENGKILSGRDLVH